jgi:hypothetical protein
MIDACAGHFCYICIGAGNAARMLLISLGIAWPALSGTDRDLSARGIPWSRLKAAGGSVITSYAAYYQVLHFACREKDKT